MSNRFGEVGELPRPAEWLTDNGSGYIAAETRAFATRHRLHPVPHAVPLSPERSVSMSLRQNGRSI